MSEQDEWVTQDRVPAREGVDERRFVYTAENYVGKWQTVGQYSKGMTHNSIVGRDTIEVRCRRRDFPSV